MARDRGRTVLWFLAGLALGTAVMLLTASRTRKGQQVVARAKETKDFAKDAARVIQRGRHLKRPLSES